MLTKSERDYLELKMLLRTLSLSTNRTTQKQLYQKLLFSIRGQNIITRTASTANPQNLPPQPVPKLEDTVKKYLNSVKPLLSEADFACATQKFEQFASSSGDGPVLQKYLEERAKCTSNWLEEWWINAAYLGFRQPVVVYSSPGQTFPEEKFKCQEQQLLYAAKMILGAATYKMLIDQKKIPVEKMGKDELDMNQYNNIFGTCRIPGCPLDGLAYNRDSKHIVVVHNGYFFKMVLFSDDSKPLSQNQIFCQLKRIVSQSPVPSSQPVGILSSDQRDNWASAYDALMQDQLNQGSLCQIQKSLFLMCLDQVVCPSGNDNRQTTTGKQLVHGGGSTKNAGNRWFDKTIQFVVSTDGVVGLTYEHSPAEGQPVAVMVDYVNKFIQKDEGKNICDGQHNCEPQPLCFNIDTTVANYICAARTNVDSLTQNFDLKAFTYKGYGKKFIKSQKLSPDSFCQMAFQYTFYRMYCEPAAHYESAATRKYLGGRTETIRSCSVESVNFAKAMLDPNAKDDDRAKALRSAINSHKQYSVEAVNGFGVDRHLLGLKLAAGELNMCPPEIFKDHSWIKSTHMRVTSSQVATKCDAFMCYGPTEHDGYGCCYNPREDTINFAISSFLDNCETSSDKFVQALKCSLSDMQVTLAKCEKAKM